MARRAFRVAYMRDAESVIQQTTYYGDSTADAEAYGQALFGELSGGYIEVIETGDVGVPDDDVLREWAEMSNTTPEAIEEMRVPGVNG